MQGEPGYASETTSAIATANGIYSAGGAIGTIFIMWSASALGRKRSIQIGGLFSLLGGALQGGAANIAYVHVLSNSPFYKGDKTFQLMLMS
jgi:MFS family permease